MKRIIPKAEMKRGKTLFLAKKRGNADSDLAKPTAVELSKVTGILSGKLKRLNTWDVEEDPEFGQREPIREKGYVTKKLLFTVEYDSDTEDVVHFDLRTVYINTQSPRAVLNADQECVFVFKGQETCDDSYGVVKFLPTRSSFGRGTTKLICEGWVKKEMSGSV